MSSKFFDTLQGWAWYTWQMALPEAPRQQGAVRQRQLLLIASDFPPVVSGGSYRPASFARYGHDMGWDVAVLTHAPPVQASAAGLQLMNYVGSQATILHTPRDSLHPSYRLFPRLDGGMIDALNFARHARRALGDRLPEIIVATGPSFNTFVAAYFLARTSGARLVLEYRDEWTLCPFDFVSKSASDAQWEQRCLQRADLVIVTTESQQQMLKSHFGHATAIKCEVVPNGWIAQDTPTYPMDDAEASFSAEKEGVPLKLTFAGMLGAHSNPAVFLESLARVLVERPELLGRIQVRFVGRKTREAAALLAEFPIPDVVQDIALLPLEEAGRMMRESDALLLFHDMRFERYIPGKLYEYVAAGRHILLFDDVGESRRILSSLGIGSCLHSDDVAGLAQVLDELFATRRNSILPRAPVVEQWLGQHTRERLAQAFYRTLDAHFSSSRS